MALTLYHFNNSVCSQKVRLALYEKGIEWDERVVDLPKLEQYAPEYLYLNPKGVVPTLVHDASVVIESTLICEYIDDVFPGVSLKPAPPADLAAMRVWTKAVDEGLHEGIVALSFSAMFRERMRKMTEDQRERQFRNIGDPERRERDRAVFEQGVEAAHVFHAVASYETLFRKLENVFGDGRAWVSGDQYTLADINLAPYAARLEYMDLLPLWISGRPRVGAWWGRIQTRPAFKAGLSDRLTAPDFEAMKKFGGAIRQRLGERRNEYLEEFGPED